MDLTVFLQIITQAATVIWAAFDFGDATAAEKKLRELASNWILDRVGKINFVDYFDDKKPFAQFPLGAYVARASTPTLETTNAEPTPYTSVSVYHIEQDPRAWTSHYIGVLQVTFTVQTIKAVNPFYDLFNSKCIEFNKMIDELSRTRIDCQNSIDETTEIATTEINYLRAGLDESVAKINELQTVNASLQNEIGALHAKLAASGTRLQPKKVIDQMPLIDQLTNEIRLFDFSSLRHVDSDNEDSTSSSSSDDSDMLTPISLIMRRRRQYEDEI
jgi:hypothetical protein